VRPVALPQAELALQVLLQHRLLLNRLQQTLVHLLLVLRPISTRLLLLRLLALSKEGLFAALLVGLLVPGKILWLRDLVYGRAVEAFEGDGGLGRDDVAGVDAAKRDAVDLEGAGDEEDSLVKDLEKDDALATEATGEEDKDFAGLKGGAGLVWAEGFASLSHCIPVSDPVHHFAQSQPVVCTFLGCCSSSAG